MRNADAVRALAQGDFSDVANRFANAGFDIQLPAQGIVEITASAPASKRLRLLLSVGIHGDETAPIEMVANLLDELAQHPHELRVDLMVVVGNLAAIAQGRRFVDADLNRMFAVDRGELQTTAEAERADAIMRATTEFFSVENGEKWHLDLHTAIRESHYSTFAIVPDIIADRRKRSLVTCLGGAGIEAVVLNSKLAPTYSAYTAAHCGASACTAELGQVGILGKNDLSHFAVTSAAIDAMMRSGETLAFRRTLPHIFHVAQEIIKRSADFHLAVDRDTPNFTPLEPGTLIARDRVGVYNVGSITEYIIFPNPDVAIGQRAGLTVVRRQ